MLRRLLRNRWTHTVTVGLLGVLAGACMVGLPALASTSHPRGQARAGKSARHRGPGYKRGSSFAMRGGACAAGGGASANVQAAVKAALQGLVTGGTINQHQADVIEGEVAAGSVDTDQLVASGLITQSQAQAVENALAQVKESFAGKLPSAGDKTGGGSSNTQAADARLHAAVNAALQGLVTNGTINQHQADVIEGQVDAGTVDPDQLVASGLITQSQAQAVGNALAAVKGSFAAHA